MLAMETDDHQPAVACQQKERLQLFACSMELLPCFMADLAVPTPSLPSKPPPAAPGRLRTQSILVVTAAFVHFHPPRKAWLARNSAEKHMAGRKEGMGIQIEKKASLPPASRRPGRPPYLARARARA